MEQQSDLDELREQFPDWRIGSMWASAASGPDKRRVTASRDGVLLTAWNRHELAAKIRREELRKTLWPRRSGDVKSPINREGPS